MRNRMLAALAVAGLGLATLGVASAAAESVPSSPTSNAGVMPYIIDGVNPGGNRTCEEVEEAFGYMPGSLFVASTARVDYPWVMYGFNIDVVTDGAYVEFEIGDDLHDGMMYSVGAAIVKGSSDANVYFYGPNGIITDSGLTSPPNASGMSAGLSNLTFCLVPRPQEGPDPTEETAYAGAGADSTCFPTAWGWTNGPILPGESRTYDLWAGAGQCDTSKGYLVGEVHITYAGGVVTVVFEAFGAFDPELALTHVYAGSARYPAYNAKGMPVVAPGNFGSTNDFSDGYVTESTHVISGLSGPIYVIAHAEVWGYFMS